MWKMDSPHFTFSICLICSIMLHKIASNSSTVMAAFPSKDHAKDLKELDLSSDPLPLQRGLGLRWDLQTDSFSFCVSDKEKPFT